MTLNSNPSESLLDDTGWAILRELQNNARISFTELGRRVGLSSPAVAERVRRMEEADIICGYRTDISLKHVGLAISAIITLSSYAGRSPAAAEAVRDLPEVLECHKITGDNCYIMRVAVESVEHLESFIDHLDRYGKVTTSLILSSPVENRIIPHSPPFNHS
jgi:Lrp/AsnC family transcriptional regulator, leucine-responsive regulatory protein